VLGVALSLLLAPLLFHRRLLAALSNALFGRREHLRARVMGLVHLAVACHAARAMRAAPEPVSHIHSQWIHSCGTVAMYLAWLLDVPFSFTGHATDLFRDRCALLDKIERADFIICISTFHRDFYLQHGARPGQCVIAYCGIDPALFHPRRRPAQAERPYRILASGRLVEKKGFAILLDACGLLADRGERFECVVGGSGPLQAALNAQIERLQLGDRVSVTGQALQQEKIIDFMHDGDVYVLPCVWAADGDVDGLPQMLMEAMACGLPAVSTCLVGIPDLIRDGDTGVLVAPNDAATLADALQRLMHDRSLSQRLADAGLRWVHERFDLRTCLDPLIERYRQRLGPAAGNAAAHDLSSPRSSTP
jgi:colanic acid/amylovoran biosynthesis glycosyltransferase